MYKDDAFPSPSAIEKMAKEYSKKLQNYDNALLKSQILLHQTKTEFTETQKVYDNFYKCGLIIDFLILRNKKNTKFVVIRDKLLRNKVLFETFFSNYEFVVFNEAYDIGQNTAIQNLFANILQITKSLTKISEVEVIRNINIDLLEVMESLI